jgi:hypothetical protein
MAAASAWFLVSFQSLHEERGHDDPVEQERGSIFAPLVGLVFA